MNYNFQTYISQASTLMAAAKLGVKGLRGITPLTPATVAPIFSTYLTPVFTLLGQFRTYIPRL